MQERAARATGQAAPPRFVAGSLLRHILVMTGTGAIGLMAIFLGDLVNMFFLGLLHDETIIAAVGYASSILFFTTSIGIGLSIAATALVAPAIGAGRQVRARRLSTSAHVLSFLVSAALALLVFISVPHLLALLGATGRTAELASGYLYILVPALPPLAVGMTSSAILRSVGDAGRAMHITLGGAVVNVVLDPIFIFALGLGIHGAALASVVARLAILAIGLWAVIGVHGLLTRPRWRPVLADSRKLAAVAVPAVLTNIATPVANAYVTAAISPFGTGAVAAWAILGRMTPVAFGVVFALSAAVGPILGQNYGARRFDRMREGFALSVAVSTGFTLAAWAALAILAHPLAAAFRATPESTELIVLYCRWQSPLFAFLGALFVANAAFNTLGRPHLSTALNWARATLGTVPFVTAGASLAGAGGVLAGQMIGGVPFGVIGVWLAWRLIAQLEAAPPRTGPPR